MRYSYLCILLAMFFLLSCTPQLPPNPPYPGGSATAGVGAAIPPVYAEPVNFYVKPSEQVLASNEIGNIDILVENDVVYRYGYILESNQWHRIEYRGDLVPDSNWLDKSERASLPAPLSDFREGTNYVLAYSCKQTGNNWDCNDGKWMLQMFTLRKKQLLPAEPAAPIGINPEINREPELQVAQPSVTLPIPPPTMEYKSFVLFENMKETYVVNGAKYEVEILVIGLSMGNYQAVFRVNGEIFHLFPREYANIQPRGLLMYENTEVGEDKREYARFFIVR